MNEITLTFALSACRRSSLTTEVLAFGNGQKAVWVALAAPISELLAFSCRVVEEVALLGGLARPGHTGQTTQG